MATKKKAKKTASVYSWMDDILSNMMSNATSRLDDVYDAAMNTNIGKKITADEEAAKKKFEAKEKEFEAKKKEFEKKHNNTQNYINNKTSYSSGKVTPSSSKEARLKRSADKNRSRQNGGMRNFNQKQGSKLQTANARSYRAKLESNKVANGGGREAAQREGLEINAAQNRNARNNGGGREKAQKRGSKINKKSKQSEIQRAIIRGAKKFRTF